LPSCTKAQRKEKGEDIHPQDSMTTVAGQNNKNPDLSLIEVIRFLSTNHLDPFAMFDLTSKTIPTSWLR